MNRPFAHFVLLVAAVVTAEGAVANQAPVLKPDSATVAEGGNVVINVLANDEVSNAAFDISSMYISSEATNGYIGIDAEGRISYTHYGGPTSADRFSYVILDDKGRQGRPAVVSIKIGSGNSTGEVTSADVASTGDTVATTSNVSTGSAATQPVITPASEVIINGRITAFHRAGQTFLTWQETDPDDEYHVYRHTRPITPQNLSSAKRITSRWGPLANNTSVNVYGGDYVPEHFVISDLAAPLDDNTGLFVYTTQPDDSTQAFYAITNVRGGRERSIMTMTTPLTESVATPVDVLTEITNQGSGRIYTQFMDYLRWNPTHSGYAYNYAVALPVNYDPGKTYPLLVELHAYYGHHKYSAEAEYGWQVVQLYPSDPGNPVGTQHSWWYGYSNSHDYRSGPTPRSGEIENFTEQRVIRAIDRVTDTLSVDENLIYGFGNSMGASGLLAFAMRYGSVFTGIYANQPMTNYATSSRFAEELIKLWGEKSRNLPIVNRGPHSEGLQSVRAGVWDWMNHQQQLMDRRGADMGFLMTMHGKQDQVIEWQSQGKPFVQALTDGSAAYTAVYDDVGHTWVGFSATIESLFGFGSGENFPFKYPLNMSFPAIQNATASDSLSPSDAGKQTYNMNIEWATPHTRFASAIVDKPARYEVSIRSNDGRQSADITPRRTQSFKPQAGQRCRYQAVDSARGETLASGNVTADRDALVTVKGMPIVTGIGTRLTINCP